MLKRKDGQLSSNPNSFFSDDSQWLVSLQWLMGSGLIGVEAASILAKSMDASTYIIEAKERVLPQFSPQTSQLVEKALSKKGVNILTSTDVAEVKEDCISFTDGTWPVIPTWPFGRHESSPLPSSRIWTCPRRTAGYWWTRVFLPKGMSLP